MPRIGLLSLIATLSLSLTACETMDNTMQSTKSAFSSMGEAVSSISMPSLSRNAEQAALSNNMETTGCPSVEIAEYLDQMHIFLSADSPVEKDKVSDLYIADIDHNCRHKASNVIVELGMTFEGSLGPRARVFDNDRPSYAFPYFIAIENADGVILAKEIFASTITYNTTQKAATHRENIRQIIPIAPNDTGDDYKILIGFQLTDEELAYNKAIAPVSETETEIELEATSEAEIMEAEAQADM